MLKDYNLNYYEIRNKSTTNIFHYLWLEDSTYVIFKGILEDNSYN